MRWLDVVLKRFLYFAFGIVSGVLAGLLPGLHPNTIAAWSSYLRKLAGDDISFLIFMVSLGITDSIVNFIPSIFLGAPEEESSLALLPGHRLLLKGHGNEAIKLCLLGSITSMLFSLLLLPFLYFLLPLVYSALREFIWLLLILVISILIWKEKNRKAASLCFLLSGTLGVLTANLPLSNALFPLLTGLFGVPPLLFSIKKRVKIPKQKKAKLKLSASTIAIHSFLGCLAGIVVGILPGIGPAQAISLLSLERSPRAFLVSNGAVATSNFLFSVLSLLLIGKARSGIAIAIRNEIEFGFMEFLFSICSAIAACGISFLLSLALTKLFTSFIEKVNYTALNLAVLSFLCLAVFVLSGWLGLFLLFVSCCIGIFAWLQPVRKSNLMGALILPSIFFYLGV